MLSSPIRAGGFPGSDAPPQPATPIAARTTAKWINRITTQCGSWTRLPQRALRHACLDARRLFRADGTLASPPSTMCRQNAPARRNGFPERALTRQKRDSEERERLARIKLGEGSWPLI